MVRKTIQLCPKGHVVHQYGKRKNIRDNLHYKDHICNEVFTESDLIETHILKGNETSKEIRNFRA